MLNDHISFVNLRVSQLYISRVYIKRKVHCSLHSSGQSSIAVSSGIPLVKHNGVGGAGGPMFKRRVNRVFRKYSRVDINT